MRIRSQDIKIKSVLYLYLFLFVFFTNSKSFSSQILDFETETFVKSLISDVINVNKINKQINFKIINDNSINAFVDKNNDIYAKENEKYWNKFETERNYVKTCLKDFKEVKKKKNK